MVIRTEQRAVAGCLQGFCWQEGAGYYYTGLTERKQGNWPLIFQLCFCGEWGSCHALLSIIKFRLYFFIYLFFKAIAYSGGRDVVLFVTALCQILQHHLYWKHCDFVFLLSYIMLICEQKMEPIGGKKSPILKVNLLHHVTSFPAGCTRTGNTLTIFIMYWLQRGSTITWREHRLVMCDTLNLSLSCCGILCDSPNFIPEFSHVWAELMVSINLL